MTPDPILDTPATARFLEQRTINPADLIPYPGNPNIGDVDAVRDSLRANGQYRSPVTRLLPDGRLQVLAGHTTRLAAIAENLPLRVDVIEADDATARRIVLADNRTAQLARYDEPALLAILDAGDLAGTGWDGDAYQKLLDGQDGGARGPADGYLPDGDPGDRYREQYGVIVICDSEPDQERTYEELKAHGFNCRVVTT